VQVFVFPADPFDQVRVQPGSEKLINSFDRLICDLENDQFCAQVLMNLGSSRGSRRVGGVGGHGGWARSLDDQH
jgi:hypothetical protein